MSALHCCALIRYKNKIVYSSFSLSSVDDKTVQFFCEVVKLNLLYTLLIIYYNYNYIILNVEYCVTIIINLSIFKADTCIIVVSLISACSNHQRTDVSYQHQPVISPFCSFRRNCQLSFNKITFLSVVFSIICT